jgi:hypothetical protein
VFLAAQLAIYIPLDTVAVQQTDQYTLRDISELVVKIGTCTIPGISLLLSWKTFTLGYTLAFSLRGAFLGVLKCVQWSIILNIVSMSQVN